MPNGTIGRRCSAQTLTIAETSSVDTGKTTASGSPGACHDSPWLWCSRTDSDTETRSPRMARSASITIPNHNVPRFHGSKSSRGWVPRVTRFHLFQQLELWNTWNQWNQTRSEPWNPWNPGTCSRRRPYPFCAPSNATTSASGFTSGAINTSRTCRRPMIGDRRAAGRGLPLVRAGDARRSEGVAAAAVARHPVQRGQDAAEDAPRCDVSLSHAWPHERRRASISRWRPGGCGSAAGSGAPDASQLQPVREHIAANHRELERS